MIATTTKKKKKTEEDREPGSEGIERNGQKKTGEMKWGETGRQKKSEKGKIGEGERKKD